MNKRLRDRLPYTLRVLSRRLIVRLVSSTIHLTKDVLNIAITNGLDVEREWKRREEWDGESNPNTYTDAGLEVNLPWSVQDFLFSMDLITTNGREKTDGSGSKPIQCSIIIPVYNKVGYTFQCLRSLMQQIDRNNEIIVVNNGSHDETNRLLSYMKDKLTAINNAENLGFVKACNQGAAIARGKYLVFLNNDTVIQPGWLRHLVDTVEADSAVGAVGSMLIYPDGRLQEAGGIIWKNGDGANYGRGEDPENRRFRFAREVDYCSAASLLVCKDIFNKLGGFDERYSPAFYEDTDLCFGVRSLGYKVIYQPMSQVVHYDGGTAGTDIQEGYKHYQFINRPKFVEKWGQTLERGQMDQPNRISAAFAQAANRQRGPRVIVFDHFVPTPNKDSGSLRMFEILRGLARLGRPVFVPVNPSFSTECENVLGKEGIEVVPHDGYKSLLKSGAFQVAILSRAAVADEVYASIKKRDPQLKIVFDTVDLHFLRLAREYKHTGDNRFGRESANLKTQESRLAAAADQVWCVSLEDKQALEREVPGAKIRIIPNIHRVHERVSTFDERNGLLFIGNFNHRPNKDALCFYVNDILPRLRELLPLTKLYVVGSNMSSEEFAYASDDIVIVGYLPDLAPLLQSARILIAPLRFGAGMKGKIGQALSYGLPVVTTTIGAEGFGLVHGSEAMLADGPVAFANAVYQVYTDDQLWYKLSDQGQKYVQQNLSPEVVRHKLSDALRSLVDSSLNV